MEARWVSPLPMTPVARPEQNPGWGYKKLTDPRAEPVLEWMAAHGVAKLSGGDDLEGVSRVMHHATATIVPNSCDLVWFELTSCWYRHWGND